jgi:hypothetical protein
MRKNIKIYKEQRDDKKSNTVAENQDISISDFVSCDNDGFVGHSRSMLRSK